MHNIIELWQTMPTSEKWGGLLFAIALPALMLGLALITP